MNIQFENFPIHFSSTPVLSTVQPTCFKNISIFRSDSPYIIQKMGELVCVDYERCTWTSFSKDISFFYRNNRYGKWILSTTNDSDIECQYFLTSDWLYVCTFASLLDTKWSNNISCRLKRKHSIIFARLLFRLALRFWKIIPHFFRYRSLYLEVIYVRDPKRSVNIFLLRKSKTNRYLQLTWIILHLPVIKSLVRLPALQLWILKRI